jgi:hypothetical protein
MKYDYETLHKNSTLPSQFIIPESEIKNVKKNFKCFFLVITFSFELINDKLQIYIYI